MNQFWSKSTRFGPNTFQIRAAWGLRGHQETLLFNKILNVGLLLFIDPTVVLLLLLTIRTVFSA